MICEQEVELLIIKYFPDRNLKIKKIFNFIWRNLSTGLED